MKINQFIDQEDQFLIAKKPFILTIDLSNYSKNSLTMRDNDSKIWVKSLISKAEFDNKIFDITLDYPIELYVYDIVQTKEFIKLKFDKDSTVLEATSEAQESSVAISYVERLIGGREILKDAAHLYRKLFGVYGGLSDMDSCHLEVMASQVLRDKKDIQIPARLGKTWDPILVNMKKVIFSEGFVNGLAFENINDAIKTGLISDEKGEDSIIEKVMTATLVDDKRGKAGRLGDTGYKNR